MNDVDVDDINDLAQFIRQINGDNKMGTARLAEEILEWQADSIQRAEPVAEYTFYLDSGIRFFPLNAFDNLPKGKGYLYTRPQPAAKVPEKIEIDKWDSTKTKIWQRGWNAAIEAMLTTPQQSTHDLAGQTVDLPDEITTLRNQLQQAEARAAELEATLYHGNLEREKCQKAMILRKQAEAVEDAANYVVGLGDQRTLLHYVQCLRQQADELEQNQ